ncbi:MAG: ribosomal-protein-alanine N-acetyltransferase [Gammaproteobacteria bacterium]|nr:MAG: ribosomal-protein-alanine N-acetyltransferase [Gammaproteobacteria bacterium]
MSAAEDRFDPSLRAMMARDLPRIAEIERSAYGYPWSPGIFRDCLLAGYTCLVIEDDGRVVAYSIMSVAAGEAHVLNVCVHPDARGRGLGRRLMCALIERALDAAARRMFLEVRPSNAVARRLYASLGFAEVGVRPRYYQAEAGREDAVVLCLEGAALELAGRN